MIYFMQFLFHTFITNNVNLCEASVHESTVRHVYYRSVYFLYCSESRFLLAYHHRLLCTLIFIQTHNILYFKLMFAMYSFIIFVFLCGGRRAGGRGGTGPTRFALMYLVCFFFFFASSGSFLVAR